jgi:hypothetical protein
VVNIDDPPKDATPLELIRRAIDKRGLPAALKQMTGAELEGCLLVYRLLQAEKRKRKYFGELTRAIKAMRKTQRLVPNLPDLDRAIATYEWFLKPVDDSPVEGVTLTKRGEIQFNDKVLQLSAFEVVAGWVIPCIFETHCGKAVGYSRDSIDETIRSEFVDFAEYVLAVLGITKTDGTPYERRAIEAALTKCRRLRNR